MTAGGSVALLGYSNQEVAVGAGGVIYEQPPLTVTLLSVSLRCVTFLHKLPRAISVVSPFEKSLSMCVDKEH